MIESRSKVSPDAALSTIAEALGDRPFTIVDFARALGCRVEVARPLLDKLHARGSVVADGFVPRTGQGRPYKIWRIARPEDSALRRGLLVKSRPLEVVHLASLTRESILKGMPFDRTELARVMQWSQVVADRILRALKARGSVVLDKRIHPRKGRLRSLWILTRPDDPALGASNGTAADLQVAQQDFSRVEITDSVVEAMVDLGRSFSTADLASAMGWSMDQSQAVLQMMERKGWLNQRRKTLWRPRINWHGRLDGPEP